jgi:hypothetical protein
MLQSTCICYFLCFSLIWEDQPQGINKGTFMASMRIPHGCFFCACNKKEGCMETANEEFLKKFLEGLKEAGNLPNSGQGRGYFFPDPECQDCR